MANQKKSRRWIWVFACLLSLGGAAYFSLKAISNRPTKIDPEKLVKVERTDLTRAVVAIGKIEAANKVEIKSKASGIIQKLPFDVGQIVRQGQVICELDQNDLLPRVREATASLNTAEAALASAKADYGRAQVEAVGPDLPFLKRDMERARSLFTGGLIAPQARDEAEKQYEMAQNRQKSAQANLAVTRAAIAKAEAQLEQTRAVLARGPRRTCATPPSCRRSAAWSFPATAISATPSAPSSPWAPAPRSS